MTVTIRGIEFQSNLKNDMGIKFYNLSHRFGFSRRTGHISRMCRSTASITWRSQVS